MRTSDSEFKQRCLAMKKGDSATVTKATGSFGFKFSDKEIVFLISGIGIAPIIPNAYGTWKKLIIKVRLAYSILIEL